MMCVGIISVTCQKFLYAKACPKTITAKTTTKGMIQEGRAVEVTKKSRSSLVISLLEFLACGVTIISLETQKSDYGANGNISLKPMLGNSV